MYEPGTILTLKEPKSTEDEPFAYDRIRVVGQSPINHADISSEWSSGNGQGVIIEPAGGHFGATLDEPEGRLQALYDVESIPEPVIIQPSVKVITPALAGATPEEAFAKAAKEAPEPEQPKRRPSPLENVAASIEDRTDEPELNTLAEDSDES